MANNRSNLWVGSLLVLIGLVYFLNNVDFIFIEDETAISIAFIGMGAYLFFRFTQKKRTGYLITASFAIFIGLVIWLESMPGFDDEFIGVIFLWGAALLFAYGFLKNTDNWGFLIPSGILFTIGGMIWLEQILWHDDVLGSVFFLGLGLTFAFLYLIRSEKNKLDWAKVPAICLVAFSAFLFLVTSESRVLDIFFPLILILTGGYLVLQATRHKSARNS